MITSKKRKVKKRKKVLSGLPVSRSPSPVQSRVKVLQQPPSVSSCCHTCNRKQFIQDGGLLMLNLWI